MTAKVLESSSPVQVPNIVQYSLEHMRDIHHVLLILQLFFQLVKKGAIGSQSGIKVFGPPRIPTMMGCPTTWFLGVDRYAYVIRIINF